MASFAASRILIFGGTGNIGQYITNALLQATPAFGQLILFTSSNTAATKTDLLEVWKAAGMTVTVGDVTSADEVVAAYKSSQADTVISCLGRGALHVQTELIRLAEESGTVQWFFPSEYGTDIEYGPKSPHEKPHQFKLAVRKYIRENVTRMKVTYLVSGPYFDMWTKGFPGWEVLGGFDAAKKEAVLIEDGEGKVGFCTMSDVGKGVVAALQHPEQSFGKALKLQSFVVTPSQILAEFEKQTGAKWTVSYTPLAQLVETEAKLWKEASPAATMATLRRIWAEGGTLYEKNDNESVGLKPEDMDSLATAVGRALAGGES